MSNYKSKTKDEILKNILNEMPAEYLKTPGTFTHDLSNALAIVMQPYESEIEKSYNIFFNLFFYILNILARFKYFLTSTTISLPLPTVLCNKLR